MKIRLRWPGGVLSVRAKHVYSSRPCVVRYIRRAVQRTVGTECTGGAGQAVGGRLWLEHEGAHVGCCSVPLGLSALLNAGACVRLRHPPAAHPHLGVKLLRTAWPGTL